MSETASTVEEMGQSSKAAEKRAADIVSTAGKMASRSNRGQKAVDDSSEVMSQIQQDSVDILQMSNTLMLEFSEVDTIVLMVKEIADQSNILSIEAEQLNDSIDSLLEMIASWRTPEFYQQKQV